MRCYGCRGSFLGRRGTLWRLSRPRGLAGVVAKRRDSLYRPGERSADWVKFKLQRQQEFVIGGFRGNGADGVDALIVGYYDDKQLRFAGKVRATGHGLPIAVPRERRLLKAQNVNYQLR
jgi:ATP-dependent DNA ligase